MQTATTATTATATTATMRQPCQRCDWRYWQVPVQQDDGKTIMVWKQAGEPCATCYDAALAGLQNHCARTKCKEGRDCPLHRHLYDRPDDWPDSYPEPEEKKKGHRRITPYHRNAPWRVAQRQRQQKQAEAERTILPMQGAEAEKYWSSLGDRLTYLMRPENLTQMARRCLTRQREEGYAPYGEGLLGITMLDVDPDARLAVLDREEELEALMAEQQAEVEQEANDDEQHEADDEHDNDDRSYIEPDDGNFDLGVFLQAG